MMSYKTPRSILAFTALAGSVLFAFFFALTFSTPHWVEQYAADFIEAEAAKQIDRTIDAYKPPEPDGALARLATDWYAKNEAQIARHKESLKLRVHERMADAIAEIRNVDCACRAEWAQWLKEGTEHRIQLLAQANEGLEPFIHATYARVVVDLKRDIRIFTAANAVAFLLVLAVALWKPQASLQLFVPGVLLTIATVVCAYCYVFEQNWLMTIIYSDYLGFAYVGYLGLAFGLLSDIVLNRARLTTTIVNGFFQAIGSAASAVPC